MAADHALRSELSRRIRDDLIQLGIVAAGEPGRTLANGDLLRIQAITRSGLIVRRALDADPRTGQRRWTGRTFVYANYGES
jgi:hypothetical protein